MDIDNDLNGYVSALAAKASKSVESGEIFAKILAPNDDSGRHGVLIPSNGYSFFPELSIPDQKQNFTKTFTVFDSGRASRRTVAYKYYQRYPERRITRLPAILNDTIHAQRLVTCSHLTHTDGTSDYYVDCMSSSRQDELDELCRLIFGLEADPVQGLHVRRPIGVAGLVYDAPLTELLQMFDGIKAQGWMDTMRKGDTGVGKTFEGLLGIKENNDQKADYKGIEIKCKRAKKGVSSGKITLFQQGPQWASKIPWKDRIRVLGRLGDNGLYSLYSQVTTKPNNLGLWLKVLNTGHRVHLLKNEDVIGCWSFAMLEKRLLEKHSRAVFVTADCRQKKGKEQFRYHTLLYCQQPSIQVFIDRVSQGSLVFEFLMRQEKSNVTPRNHGYPWRLSGVQFLEDLFAYQAPREKFP